MIELDRRFFLKDINNKALIRPDFFVVYSKNGCSSKNLLFFPFKNESKAISFANEVFTLNKDIVSIYECIHIISS